MKTEEKKRKKEDMIENVKNKEKWKELVEEYSCRKIGNQIIL